MNEDVKFDLEDGETFTFADLNQLTTDDIDEVRSFSWPSCRCQWRVKEAKTAMFERSVEGQPSKKRFPGISVVVECTNPLNITDTDPQFKDLKPDDLVGKEKVHSIVFNKGLPEGLGRLKALMKDTGYDAPAGRQLGDQLLDWCGTQFEASINRRRDSNNSDIVYANLNTMAGQIKPIA